MTKRKFFIALSAIWVALILIGNVVQAETSKIKISQGIYFKTSSPIYQGQANNFDFWLELRNISSESLTYEAVAVAMHNSSGGYIRDLYYKGSTTFSAYGTVGDRLNITQNPITLTESAGQYQLIAKVRFDGQWYSVSPWTTSQHNEVWFTIAPPAKPDLVIVNESVSSSSIEAGNNATVYFGAKNQGAGSAGSHYVECYLSSNTSYSSTYDTPLGSVWISGLSAGETQSKSRIITIPASTSAGTWYILFIADGRYSIAESNESNNIEYASVTVSQKQPDLVVQSESLDKTTVVAGDTIDAYCIVRNQGEANAGDSNLKYYLSTNPTYDSGDIWLRTSWIHELSINESQSKQNPLTIPANTESGYWYILFRADADNEVAESIESNNVKYIQISVTDDPCAFDDLFPSDWWYDATRYLCANGIIHGDDNTNTIRPTDPINRAEIAKIAYLGAGIDQHSYADDFPSPFNDLQDETVWYYKFVKNLCYLEFGDGISPFNRREKGHINVYPAANINRGHALKVLLETWDIDIIQGGSVPFTDVPVNHEMYDYIYTAWYKGIIGGDQGSETIFRPDEDALRAEIFMMVFNIMSEQTIPEPTVTLADFFMTGPFPIDAMGIYGGLEKGNFKHYSKNSFSIPGRNVALNFTHLYNAYSTELPDDFFPLKPLSIGWTHTYDAYIIETPESRDFDGTLVGQKRLIVHWPDNGFHVYDHITNPSNPTAVTKGIYDIMTQISSSVYEIKKKNQVVYQFELKNSNPTVFVLTAIKDRNNNTITLTYETGVDNLPRIAQVTGPAGRSLVFSYTPGTNLVASVSAPVNRNIRFNYSNGQLTSFIDAMNQTYTYTYGTLEKETYLLKTIRLPEGNVINNTYDQRKLKSSWLNNNTPTELVISSNYGNPQASDYYKVAVSVPKNSSQEVTYYFSFNQTGMLTHLDGPPGIDISTQYNDSANPSKPTTVSDSGVTYQFQYDNMGNATQVGKNDGSTTITESFLYNSDNDIIQYTNPKSKITVFTYTGGNLTSIRDPLNQTTLIAYNGYGQVTSITNPSNVVIQYGYNSYGNRNSITIPSLSINAGMTYDGASRIISQRDFKNKTTSYIYNNNDKLTKATAPLSNITNYGYDNNGNLSFITNARGFSTTMGYNANTDLLESVTFGGFTKRYTYNDDGTLKTFTDANNRLFNYSYDTSGRLTSDGYATYTYDTYNNLKTISKGGNTITYGYDGFNRVTSVTYNDFSGNTVQYQYDDADNITRIIYPGNKAVTYIYDDNNRLDTVTDWLGNSTMYRYRSDGQLSRIIYPTNVLCDYSYDNAGRLTGMSYVRNSGSGTTIASYSYTLDNMGNHLNVNITQPMAYPTLYSESESYTYTNTNRVQSAGSTSFSYENNGNTTSKTGYTFSYDSRNNLTNVSGNFSASYTYDGAGHRRSASKGGVTTRYVLDILGMSRVLMETDASGNPRNYYIYGLGLIARIKPDTTTHYYIFDSRGSTVAMTDASVASNITHKYAYDSYGTVTDSQEADFNPFRYVGKYGVMYEDESLYFMRARYYDPDIGRFLSEDPIWSTNLYPYAENNPLMNIDPLGTDTYGIGASGSAAFIGSGSVEAQLVIDDELNIGIVTTEVIGGGTPSASLQGTATYSNVGNIYDLEKGISGCGGMSGGAIVGGGFDVCNNSVSINVGIKGTPFVEGHGGIAKSQVLGAVNLKTIYYGAKRVVKRTIEIGKATIEIGKSIYDWFNE